MRSASWKRAGIPVGVALVPVLPYVNDTDLLINATLRAVSEAGADFVIWDYLHIPTERHRARVGDVLQRIGSYPPNYYRDLYRGVSDSTMAAAGWRRCPTPPTAPSATASCWACCDALNLAVRAPHHIYAGKLRPANEAALLLKHTAARDAMQGCMHMAALGQELAALVYENAADDSALRQSPLYSTLREIPGHTPRRSVGRGSRIVLSLLALAPLSSAEGTPMRTLLNLLRWLLIGVVALALLAGGGGYLWLRGALPQTAGTLEVQGADAPVEILRDTDGVPHIYARTEADALFGLGYAHAQDRLWQMEFQRRVGNGRLSEVLGDATLDIDKFLRTLGTARAAASAWANANPAERKVVEYYVAGINAFIAGHHGRQLPIEFTILGSAPEPWRPEDVLVWGKMMAWDLGGNWEDELLRTKLNAQLGPEKAAQLMPAHSADGPIILPDDSTTALYGGASALASVAASGPSVAASQKKDTMACWRSIASSKTSWAWAARRSAATTGWSAARIPPPASRCWPTTRTLARRSSIWYLAHLSGGRLDAIGATLPGVPGIIIGHNQQIAWGVTNTEPDVQDLYVERVNERESGRVYRASGNPCA